MLFRICFVLALDLANRIALSGLNVFIDLTNVVQILSKADLFSKSPCIVLKEGVINFKFIFDCSHTHKEGAISNIPSLPCPLMEPTQTNYLLLQTTYRTIEPWCVSCKPFWFRIYWTVLLLQKTPKGLWFYLLIEVNLLDCNVQ